MRSSRPSSPRGRTLGASLDRRRVSSRLLPRARRALAALALGIVALVAWGCTASGSATATPGPTALNVRDAWVRAPVGATDLTAAYFTIEGGPSDTRLISISSPSADSASLHRTVTDASGMTGMQALDAIPIPARQLVQLAPGGYHVMLEGLRPSLAIGDHVELDLVFDGGIRLVVDAEVRAG
jgi:periplasmic copper chaperone A